jgi:hypothetical protein
MNKQQIGILTGIFVLAIIGTIIYLNRTSEQFVKCICSQNDGGRGRVCQDTETAWIDYEKGATEYQKFKPKGWSSVNAGDVNYPPSNCEAYTYSKNAPNSGEFKLI